PLDLTGKPMAAFFLTGPDPRDNHIQSLRNQVEHLKQENQQLLDIIKRLIDQVDETANTTKQLERKMGTVAKQAIQSLSWAKIAATNTTASTKKAKPAAKTAPAPKVVKSGGIPTPIITKPLAKCDRRIIVHREAYREPVLVDRLVELR